MSNRETVIETATTYLDGGGVEADRARLVACPTQSQIPEGLPFCVRYLDEMMIPEFREMGFECHVYDNPIDGCGPVLLATRIEDPALPTVLGYGHGDVIRGLDQYWTKGAGPWTLARDGERLYGRGTADNKGQHLINMRALRAVLTARGSLGFNAKFMIEMGEENGSKGLNELISANREAFAADVLIASDGPRVNPNIPTVSLGCRGAINFELVCNLREGAHHSGNWGGVIADPAVLLIHAIATIVDPKGKILVEEWRPPQPTPLVRELCAQIELDGGPNGPVLDPDWGEPGFSPAENLYAWNSFAVLAMKSGVPESPVNAISASANAVCQLRYIVGTDVDDIIPALRRHFEKHGVVDVKVSEPPEGNAGGFAACNTPPDNPWAVWVRESLQRTDGRAPAVIPQMGGSICNDLFTDLLGIPAIWLPHSYTGCSQHAPDEHVLLPTSRSALALMAGLYWDLGEGATPR